jgi:peptidoglycan DL-endopeptidase LytE
MRKKPLLILSVLVAFFFFAGNALCAPKSKGKPRDGGAHRVSKKHHSSKETTGEVATQKNSAAKQSQISASDRKYSSKKTRAKSIKKQGNPASEPDTVVSGLSQQDSGKDNDEYIQYRLKRGESIEKIAERFNVDTQEIIDLNNVGKKRPAVGSIVYIPKLESEETDDAPIVLNDRLSKPWKTDEERGLLVSVAKSFAGAPYRYGGDSVRGLDCSAFVRKMYNIFGVQLPRSAKEQYCVGPRVDKEELLTGDLVFFRTKRFAKYPTHVGIYIGNGMFIHASSTLGQGVKVDRLSEAYYERTYTGAVRIKAPPPTDRTDSNPTSSRNSDNS